VLLRRRAERRRHQRATALALVEVTLDLWLVQAKPFFDKVKHYFIGETAPHVDTLSVLVREGHAWNDEMWVAGDRAFPLPISLNIKAAMPTLLCL
jgi:hypothetical protein